MNSPKTLGDISVRRHSCSHVLASAVLKHFPEVKLGIGPPTEEGFYYDFDFGQQKILEEDLLKISATMRQIMGAKLSFIKEEIPVSEAKKRLLDQPFKLELITALEKEGAKKVSLYKTGDFFDLCQGPHLADTAQIGPFKLLSLASAYWRGSEKNPRLTRIYGTCFPTQEELDHYLWRLEEAKKRDHRKLGKLLDLFLISEEVGAGLLIWTPKGTIIRQEIEKFILREQTQRGYLHVFSPHIGKKSLWVTSGHWQLYREKMYAPAKIDKVEYLLKPMNCPMHMMIYKSHLRSYRELPLRIAENATVYRYEQTGELAGMIRVRYITQDDAHIFCRPDQVISEFIQVLEYLMSLLKAFKIQDFYLRFSTRDPKNKAKYLGDDQIWEEAEGKISQAVKKLGIIPKRVKGEAAFYGPKLDVMVKDSLGREWQCGTIQVDFMLPERFKLEYVAQDGQVKRPVLIHRAPLGSLERWVGLLIEHYGGAFPLWLSPIQVKVVPIADRHQKYARQLLNQLKAGDIRGELDDRSETMQAKIREATLQKIPYMVIIGDKELKESGIPPKARLASGGRNQESGIDRLVISVRTRRGEDLGQLTLEGFLEKLKKEIEDKA